jgi:putative transposase
MAKVQGRRRHRSVAQWRALVERHQQSGLDVAAFCRAESVSAASFYRWRRQLAGEVSVPATVAAAPRFIELGALGAHRQWELELELGAGVVLRLRRG